MKKLILSGTCFLLVGISCSSLSAATKTVLSPVYTIDKIYKSMEGPQSSQQVTLQEGLPELVWITGFRTEMVGPDGETPTLPEFMCHVNLDFDVAKHKILMGSGSNSNNRILTLSQGQVDVKFPSGFGMPLISNEPLSLVTQVLNHNLEHPNMQVRHKVTFHFVRDQDLKKPLTPLFNISVFGMKLLEGTDGHFGMMDMKDSKHGPSCLPGDTAPNAHGGSIYNDAYQKKFTGHWVVKPGREENHTNVTKYLNLPYDTTLHYAAVHLHPYAESLELRDLTSGKTVFKSKARSFKNKIGLSDVDSFSSSGGVPMFMDHEYDLISRYNNTTSSDKDSMAVILLFMLDKNFKKPTLIASNPVALEKNSAPLDTAWLRRERESVASWKNQKILLKTTLGDLVVTMDPKTAPVTVAHFTELVRAGAYDSTKVLNILPGFLIQFGSINDRTTPLTDSQRALIHRVPLEPGGLKHAKGVLSMARDPNEENSAESSFCILLGNAPHLDGKYTTFGTVEMGMDVLNAIEKIPRNENGQPQTVLQIEKAEILNAQAAAKLSKTSSSAVAGGGSHPANGVQGTSINALGDDVLKAGQEKLQLQTSMGLMTFNLFPGVAPKTVEQILRLVHAGAYDSVRISRVEPGFVAQVSTVYDRKTPLTPEQKMLIKKIPAEFSALHHQRGVLSMAREDNDINSAENSFSILLGDAPHLDGKYTVFGELASGADVLAAIEKVPRHGNVPDTRIDVLKADIIAPSHVTSAGEAPSCHPNEGSAMPVTLKAYSENSGVIPTDKPVVSDQGQTPQGEHYKTLVFKGLEIDKLYPSMRGPWTRAYMTLEPDQPRLWITGYRAEVLDGVNGKASQEFMCHTKFDQVAAPQAASAQGFKSFFVISQGQDEIRFPNGFGLRVENPPDRRYDVNVMVLNNNYPNIKRKLDFKATVTYLRESEAKQKSLIPLSLMATSVSCQTDSKKVATGEEVCKPASPGQMQNSDGSTGHWLVPPGRHRYHQAVPLGLAQDTTVHYIMAHLHPHAESMELRDLTTNQSVWIGQTLNDPNPANSLLVKTDYFSSIKGKPLYKDHRYEVIAVYNNPTDKDIDAMASFWIYIRTNPA